MQLFLIRHGETIWNKFNKLQGSQDIELSEEGTNAAKKLGDKLENFNFHIVFSSPLKRAFKTALLVTKERNSIIMEDCLKELNFGDLEGHTYEEMENSDHPSKYFFSAPEKFQPAPNGESLESLCQRTKEFIQNKIEPLYAQYQNNCVMVVAHGAVNHAIMCYLENHSLEDFWKKGLQKNCTPYVYNFDGKSWEKIN